MAAPFDGSPLHLSVIVADAHDELLRAGVFPSLSKSYQRDAEAFEVLVLASPERSQALMPVLGGLDVPTKFVELVDPARFFELALGAASGQNLCFLTRPGIASPTLLSTTLAALEAYGDAVLLVPTFEVPATTQAGLECWLRERGWPERGHALLDGATSIWARDPGVRWLDPIARHDNLIVSRHLLERIVEREKHPFEPEALGQSVRRTQLVGDGVVLPHSGDQMEDGALERSHPLVDPSLDFFGTLRTLESRAVPTRRQFSRRERPRLSVILIVHDMGREAPRTLRSLSDSYQEDIGSAEYEVIVVDNASREPLGERVVRDAVPSSAYYYLRDAPPSPAYAINYGVARASGDALAIMVDGACLLSPGVLSQALLSFRAFPEPVVVTRYFVLGPGLQRLTMQAGYDQTVEDGLLSGIAWPETGYRLFEISSPLTWDGGPNDSWFTAWFESNCLFMTRSVFERIGGCDERFDFPGGGAMNIDLFMRACGLDETQPVQLLGEGVFHQVHGGITSNTTQEDAEGKGRLYREQYERLRGKPISATGKCFYFLGRLRTPACRWKMEG